MRVCIYCASSTKISQHYLTTATNIGTLLACNNIITVYGGGSVGSMGALANAVLINKGTIIGIIPQFMMDLEWGNKYVTELIVVNTMAERKQKLIENVDAVVALPGGTGTLEELIEVISLKKLGLFTKPIIIINSNGFYNGLIELFEKMINENFMHSIHRTLYTVINEPNELLTVINNSIIWDNKNAQLWAAI